MKTNYNNLTKFEICAIFVAALGITFIGWSAYISMSPESQVKVVDAMSILDMHEQFISSANTAVLAYGATQNFYNEFYLAFAQTLSFPERVGMPLIHLASGLDDLSQILGSNYAQNSSTHTSAGEVLGSFLIHYTGNVTAISATAGARESLKPKKQYYYHAPNFVINQFQK